MDPKNQAKMIALGAAILVLVVAIMSSSFVIPPGHRGVIVTMGNRN